MSRLPVFQHPPPIACLVAVLATLATPGTARAADSEPDAPETSGVTAGQPGRQSAPDFLFGRPRSVVGVAWGWLVASQSGGIFDFTRDLLTVDEGDFDTGMFRLEAGLSIGPPGSTSWRRSVSAAPLSHRSIATLSTPPICRSSRRRS